MKSPYTILVMPLLSEKSLALSEETGRKQYVFKVDIKANKKVIKKAVEDAFKVHVLRVNTIRMKGKPKRVRQQPGYRADWKKAYVTLKVGESIDLI